MLKKFFALPLLLLLAAAAFSKTIDIYHTSDTHGFYYPREIDNKLIGGFAVLGEFLKHRDNPYLLLDSGDWSTGTAEDKATKGHLSVQLMNMLGYHAVTIGNHESNYGQEAMLKNIGNMKADVLAANLYDKELKGYPANVKPFKIYLVDGKKIAVIGLAMTLDNQLERIKTTDMRRAVKDALDKISKQNPDAVILLAHMSIMDDKHLTDPTPDKVIKGLRGIDIVLGGHVHKIQNEIINNVVYIGSGAELKGLSKITLDFDDDTGRLKDIKAKYIELDAQAIGQDPYVQEAAEAGRLKDLDTVISNAAELISKANISGTNAIDSPLGNIFADFIREYSGADIGMHNTGAVRTDIPKGPITKRLASVVNPFPNKIMVVNVNGKFIRNLARMALKGNKSLFQYSAMTVVYKVDAKGKIKDIIIKVNGAPLDDKKVYSIAINDYIAAGNSEGVMFKKEKNKKLFGTKSIHDLFLEFLQNNQEIRPAPTGRIIVEK